MSRGGVTLSEEQRLLLARVVRERGAQRVCERAGLRSEQSLFRALAGAPVLPLTLHPLRQACEQLQDNVAESDTAPGRGS